MPWPSWLSANREQSNDISTLSRETLEQKLQEVQSTLSKDALVRSPTNTVIVVTATSISTLALAAFYRRYLRRIPNVTHLKPTYLHKRSLYGYVTSVGDGDGFRLFHTPGGRVLGWGWASGRRVQDMSTKELRDKTLSIRIAGIDAPEMGHFGKETQPHAQEAMDWLRSYVLHRYVRVYPYRKDQYDRAVCAARRKRFLFFNTDVGYQMIKCGLATVYEAKFGSEFGDSEQKYRDAEALAKTKKLGMWVKPGIIGMMLGTTSQVETPRQYKSRMARRDAQERDQPRQNDTSRLG